MPRNYVKKSLRQKSNYPPQIPTTFPPETPIKTAGDRMGITDHGTAPTRDSLDGPSVLVGLGIDPSTTAEDKYERSRVLYAKWKYEDTEEVVEGADLLLRQKCRIKDIGSVVFGFTLHETQIEAIWTLFYERRDLLLLAKSGFGKSFIL